MSGNLFDDGLNSGAAAEWLTAHCDGGSRGNPGPSGYGAVVEDGQGRVVARLSEYLGKQTNNYAEYAGLLAVLKWASAQGVKNLRVVSDSELMVKQMKGLYKVASPGLRPLWEEAKRLAGRLERFEMRHTLRGGNQEADRLANEAMDRGMGKGAGAGGSVPAHPGGKDKDAARTGRQAGGVGGAGKSGGQPAAAPARPERIVLEGYVKGGVVHLLNGELPDGVFVKIIRE